MDNAADLIERLSLQPQVSLHTAKTAINDSLDYNDADGLRMEQLHYLKTLIKYDGLEALNGFKKKRKPEFRDE
ncbi:hypothetical protein [Salinicoccus halodurans]|uniref:Enoyl-CoA hydratase n=1 Tax=Salinicoccus halodurans TaxID=407035 RepID=A0ABN4G1C0_9STAP|nr:hypothetical protein [Salinicoccus halodurans]AKG74290.1 hypothetical protein AAT16_08630 [Salinicoccus halodurans]